MSSWACEAYGAEGREVGALCFVSQPWARVCRDRAECSATMAAERRRVFRRINELAAAGEDGFADLSDEITTPGELLNGGDEDGEAG